MHFTRASARKACRTIRGAMDHSFLSAFILMLLVLDPLGSLPVFIPIMRAVAPQRRRRVALREVAIAFVVLLGFMFAGDAFLRVMHLSERSLEVAGGVILLMVAIRMIFSHEGGVYGMPEGREPLIFPLAVPLLAGPSAMATVLLLASRQPDRMARVGRRAHRRDGRVGRRAGRVGSHPPLLGDSVVSAIEKLMGLVLTAIAVEMILAGLKRYFFGGRSLRGRAAQTPSLRPMHSSPEPPPRGGSSMTHDSLQPPSEREAPEYLTSRPHGRRHLIAEFQRPARCASPGRKAGRHSCWSLPLGGRLEGAAEQAGAPAWRGLGGAVRTAQLGVLAADTDRLVADRWLQRIGNVERARRHPWMLHAVGHEVERLVRVAARDQRKVRAQGGRRGAVAPPRPQGSDRWACPGRPADARAAGEGTGRHGP
jgi:small neutral amino acid transporter SnatA (MarC family)